VQRWNITTNTILTVHFRPKNKGDIMTKKEIEKAIGKKEVMLVRLTKQIDALKRILQILSE
jgi:hypothetical protein